jgi:hypothetical protein
MSFDRGGIDPCTTHASPRLRRVAGLLGARRRIWVLGIALLVALSLLRSSFPSVSSPARAWNQGCGPEICSVHAVVAREQIVGKVIRSIRLRLKQGKENSLNSSHFNPSLARCHDGPTRGLFKKSLDCKVTLFCEF